MKPFRKAIVALIILCGVVVVISLINSSHLTQACDEAREEMKQLMLNDNGLAGAIATLPEATLDKALDEHFSTLSDQQCETLAPQLRKGREVLSQTKWAPRMHEATKQAVKAVAQCRDKRLRGELKTHAESVECSAPQIKAAFARIGYPYLDLVDALNAKRLDEARQLDGKWLAGLEDQLAFARLALEIAQQEMQRNGKAIP